MTATLPGLEARKAAVTQGRGPARHAPRDGGRQVWRHIYEGVIA
ncbi:hypothetical protein [Limobrevibacterium gyesilva]|uniref:Uncharacterized protein n=1 Tax=Limobrevibacterium gyesilva TaxID=2991712 RepID=A0AA41YQU6_9PROT|nr:hypothetical protein [Limobrevibacterium gyesilva]MCW3474953.1 hypothetical protein [Limobrevibacterium gyesilva]